MLSCRLSMSCDLCAVIIRMLCMYCTLYTLFIMYAYTVVLYCFFLFSFSRNVHCATRHTVPINVVHVLLTVTCCRGVHFETVHEINHRHRGVCNYPQWAMQLCTCRHSNILSPASANIALAARLPQPLVRVMCRRVRPAANPALGDRGRPHPLAVKHRRRVLPTAFRPRAMHVGIPPPIGGAP